MAIACQLTLWQRRLAVREFPPCAQPAPPASRRSDASHLYLVSVKFVANGNAMTHDVIGVAQIGKYHRREYKKVADAQVVVIASMRPYDGTLAKRNNPVFECSR